MLNFDFIKVIAWICFEFLLCGVVIRSIAFRLLSLRNEKLRKAKLISPYFPIYLSAILIISHFYSNYSSLSNTYFLNRSGNPEYWFRIEDSLVFQLGEITLILIGVLHSFHILIGLKNYFLTPCLLLLLIFKLLNLYFTS